MIKHRAGRCLAGVTRRVVRGTEAAIAAVLVATGTGTGINTAYIERLNATFRGALSPLTRRGRAIARGADALTAGMYLVGCAYNFCWAHDSLRVAAGAGAASEVAGADAGDGGRVDGSSLDDAGVAQPADPAAALGAAEAPRATTQATPGGHGMTTVPCGATTL